MTMKLIGIVTEDVVQNEDQCKYKINADGEEYLVLSTGIQAAKDNIFIRKGQQMEIECRGQKSTNNEMEVLAEKSKILLSKLMKNRVDEK